MYAYVSCSFILPNTRIGVENRLAKFLTISECLYGVKLCYNKDYFPHSEIEILSKHKVLKQMLSTGMRHHR